MNKMQKKNVKSMIMLLTLLGICLMCSGLISKIIPITYGTNDDMVMRDIASGAMTGRPDGHLIFVKFALGYLMSILYRLIPCIDWYGCIWMGLICVCISLLLYRGYFYCKNKNFLLFCGIFFCLFLLMGLEHLVSFQFTIVAGIIAGTSIFFFNTIDMDNKKNHGSEYMIVVILMLFSYCVRSEVFLMAVPFAGLIFLFKNDSRKNKIIFATICLIGIIIIAVIEAKEYSKAEWKEYLEYNQYRSDIYDYYGIPLYAENVEFYSKIDMDEFEVSNLDRYHLYFIDDIETWKMKEISNYARQLWLENNNFTNRIKAGIKCSIIGFFNLENLFLNLFAKIILIYNLIYELKNRKKSFFQNIGFLIIEGVLWLYLGYQGRLPARVGAALLFIECLSAMSIFYQEQKNNKVWKLKRKWINITLVLLLMITSICKIGMVSQKQQEIHRSNKELELLENYFGEHKENVYFVNTYLTAGYTENFKVFREFNVSNGFALGGWTCFSPVKKEGLQYFDILEVDKALIEKDNVYLIMVASSSKVEKYYEKKYGEIRWEKIDQAPIFGVEVPVYQIRLKEKENDTF